MKAFRVLRMRNAGLAGSSLTSGAGSITTKAGTTWYVGYNASAQLIGTQPSSTFGSLGAPTTFKTATIKGLYSWSSAISGGSSTTANAYYVVFSGNRAAGFVSSLMIDGVLVPAVSISAPGYDSTNNETYFYFSLGSGVYETNRLGAAGSVHAIVLG